MAFSVDEFGVTLCNGVRLLGGNLTIKGEYYSSPNGVWAEYFNQFDFEGWIKPQIDLAASIGCNAIRQIGDIRGIMDGLYSRATYHARYGQIIDYAASKGLLIYANCFDGRHVNNHSNSEIEAEIAAFAAFISGFENVVALDVCQEINDSVGDAEIAAEFVAVAKANTSLPCANSFGGTFSTNGAFGGYLAAAIANGYPYDFLDFHVYADFGPGIRTRSDIDALEDAGINIPMLCGEFGSSLSLGNSQQVSDFNTFRDQFGMAYKVAGCFVWALTDQNTDPSDMWGISTSSFVPRSDLISALQEFPKTSADVRWQIAGNWSTRVPITIPANQVGIGGVVDETVYLSDQSLAYSIADIFAGANADLSDLRFAKNADGTSELGVDLLEFDSDEETLSAQVGPLTITDSGDTIFYLFFGNPRAARPTKREPNGQFAAYAEDVFASLPVEPELENRVYNGAEPTASGGTIGNGKMVDGVVLDGTGGIQLSPSAAANPATLFLCGWFKIVDGGNFTPTLLSTTGSGYDRGMWLRRTDTNSTALNCYAHIAGNFRGPASASFAKNTWQHVAATYDGEAIRIFVNGAEGSSFPYSGTITPGSASMGIGITGGTTNDRLAGTIDQVTARASAQPIGWAETLFRMLNAPSEFLVGGEPEPMPPPAPSGNARGTLRLGYTGKFGVRFVPRIGVNPTTNFTLRNWIADTSWVYDLDGPQIDVPPGVVLPEPSEGSLGTLVITGGDPRWARGRHLIDGHGNSFDTGDGVHNMVHLSEIPMFPNGETTGGHFYRDETVLTKLAVFDGNSITKGNANSYFNSYPQQWWNGNGSWRMRNQAVGGQTTIDMISRAEEFVDAFYDPVKWGKNILLASEMTNDRVVNNATAAQAIDHFTTYCQGRMSAGWKFIVGTVLPRTEGSFTPEFMEECNAFLRDPANIGVLWHAVADFQADPRLGTTDLNEEYYVPGGIHPNDSGSKIMAQISGSIIASL